MGIPGSSSTSQHHHTTVSSEINKHDFSATYLPDTVFPIALSRPHFTRHQSKHRASRITTTTPATMNLGSFGKLSIVYAVLALFLIIVSLGLLALTMLFWFAGSIAMAVLIGVPD